MDTRYFADAERATLILAAVAVGLAVVLLPRSSAYAVSVGAGLTCLNAMGLRWLSDRASRLPEERRAGVGLLLFTVKMFLLIAMVFLAIRVLGVSPTWFVVGLSIFPVAILTAGLRSAIRTDDGSASTPDSSGDPKGDLNG